jgi:hypothetical protein
VLMEKERGGLIAEHRNAMLRDPAQFPMCNSMSHER